MPYTLRVKETYHFFRATLTKIHCIKINHIWIQISYSYHYEAHLKKLRVWILRKLQWNRKMPFSKYHRNSSLSELHKRTKGCLFRTCNYSFNFNVRLCNHRTGFRLWRTPMSVGQQVLWFSKNYLMLFHCIFLLLDTRQSLLIRMLLLRSTLSYMCPNI